MVEHRVPTDDEMEEHDRLAYGTPTADQPDPDTGLTPNEEQVVMNRRINAALDRLAQDRLHQLPPGPAAPRE